MTKRVKTETAGTLKGQFNARRVLALGALVLVRGLPVVHGIVLLVHVLLNLPHRSICITWDLSCRVAGLGFFDSDRPGC